MLCWHFMARIHTGAFAHNRVCLHVVTIIWLAWFACRHFTNNSIKLEKERKRHTPPPVWCRCCHTAILSSFLCHSFVFSHSICFRLPPDCANNSSTATTMSKSCASVSGECVRVPYVHKVARRTIGFN